MRKHADDSVTAEYAAAANDYDRKWAFYIDSTARETLSRLKIVPGDRVLDVGCGTGELLARIAAKSSGTRLAGLDPVPEMLARAKEKLSSEADLRVGYADSLPWPDGSFDIVLSCNVFHYIQHPLVAIREMERVLRPGGQMVITDWCDDYLACRICNVYLRLTRRSFFKTYRQSECLSLLEKAGQRPSIERYKINWLWGMMTATARTA
jgi:ubiquinone/menaquinone biosynthesis C-methylase UbiE